MALGSNRGGRRQSAARRAAEDRYPYVCCAICGLQLRAALDLAHLDNDAANNDADNLAWLCKTHHRMTDDGLYPLSIVKALRDHWQATRGQGDPKRWVKDAGEKAAATKARKAEKAKRSEIARKAVATRRSREEAAGST